MLEPIKPRKLYEDIVDHFLQLIQSGQLLPGDQLPTEKELAKQMHVSKTAVREAMSAMESMGYTKSRVGEGTFVSDVSLDSLMLPMSIVLTQDNDLMENLMELRVILEARTAELAAQRITPEQLERLEQFQAEMRREMKNEEKFSHADRQFHVVLAQSSGNRVFHRIFEMCHSMLDKTIASLSHRPGQLRVAYEKHLEILDAVRAGNGTLAAQCMREHLEQNRQMVKEGFRRRNKDFASADGQEVLESVS